MEKKSEVDGAFILTVRQQLNLSQAELAEAMGVTERTIRRWENEESPLPAQPRGHMEALCKLDRIKVITSLRSIVR